jgi:CHAD domain-containing protein
VPHAPETPSSFPTWRAVRRSARRAIDDALAALTAQGPIGDRIHEVRTAIKRARALGHLIRAGVGRPARDVDRRLRAVARSVSALRDADVLLAAFDRLLPSPASSPSSSPLQLARAELAARLSQETHALGRAGRLSAVAASLRRARRRIKRWRVQHGQRGGRAAVAAGLREGYGHARRAMARAGGADARGDRLHAWRRATKRHQHQLRLYQDVQPGMVGARLADLDALGDRLGEEHDLALLEGELALLLGGEARRRALAAARRRRRRLRAEVLRLGRRLFADQPGRFARRMTGPPAR